MQLCSYERKILVYNDIGTSKTSVLSLLSTLKIKLYENHIKTKVGTISSNQILDGELDNADCIIVPGGADLPYCKKLNGKGNNIIKEFVYKGNLYIGICAGGYYGSSYIKFIGNNYKINGSRELSLFKGSAIGSITSLANGLYYDKKTATKNIINLKIINGKSEKSYYHGGAYFIDSEDSNVFAYYDCDKVAAVYGSYGLGKYFLTGTHFELCPDIYKKTVLNKSNLARLSKDDIYREYMILNSLKDKNYGNNFYKKIAEMLTCS